MQSSTTHPIVAVLRSPGAHIIAQGPRLREFEIERDGKTLACAEVSIGGSETRMGPLVNQPD